jgi:hypothetical protein
MCTREYEYNVVQYDKSTMNTTIYVLEERTMRPCSFVKVASQGASTISSL